MKLQFLTMESVKSPQSVSLHILISLQQSHTDYSNIYLEFFNTHSRIFPHDEQNWLIFLMLKVNRYVFPHLCELSFTQSTFCYI